MNHYTKERVNSMLIANKNRREYYLFYDIFIHWSGKKITATAPYYGDDINWKEHGVDLNNIVLTVGNVRVTANYIPHRLDSWEPTILFDFESHELLDLISNSRLLTFTVTVGPHQQTFTIDCCPAPDHSVAMSVIIKDENQWIKHYLDYYLLCLDVSHIFVYDNYTADRHRLHEILEPYISLGKVTYISWHYRWRNQIDNKQIGQPPQQSHTLNRYGATPWIGLLDVDEFLRIPGKTLPEFLAQYNPDEIDGLSFGIRWFMYKGDLNIQAIDNPLFSFFHCKPDKLGRKRQKLMVSARHVRFLRFHWLEEGKRELQITDPNIFFHHYYFQHDRFERGKQETDTTYDGYMLRFRSVLNPTSDSPQGLPNTNKNEKIPKGVKNKDQWIEHVEEAFVQADNEQSKLTQDILDLKGMCGTKNRHLLNNLCNFEGCKYIEIGSLAGASLCAAMFGNSVSATAIDNWSQFGGRRKMFFENINKHLNKTDLTVIENDCFGLALTTLPSCNVFYYDGEHSKENQYWAIKYFRLYPTL